MGRKRRWTDEQLVEAVAQSRSVLQVLKKLGLKPTGANYKFFDLHAERLGADTSHFTRQGWNTGVDYESHCPHIPIEDILVENSTYASTSYLKKRLLDLGWLEGKCVRCGISSWLDSPLSLHLHHLNGKRRDNRLDNLAILCPNCHSQTKTFAGKNNKSAEGNENR